MMQTGFRTVLGTGGIGTGIVFRLAGKHDLGRNESRPARRVDQRDFCKLHIILHYVAVLCRDLGLNVRVVPVGAVGNDDEGHGLLAQMKQAGMTLKHVRRMKDARTLFSVCYQFPDGSGGNLTEMNSASGKISPAIIHTAAVELRRAGARCLVLAAPEVPLDSRIELLRAAKRHGAYTAAAFVSHEMSVVRRRRLLELIDLLSINLDEAAALADVSFRKSPRQIVQACWKYVRRINPRLHLCITDGSRGAFGLAGETVQYLPALKVKVVNTAGAGDAALAGQILGVLTGLPFLSRHGWSCFRLGRLLAAMSVTSPDTIHFGVNRRSLRAFAAAHGEKLTL